MGEGAFPGHMPSKAAERMVRLRKVSGPMVTGVKSLEAECVFISTVFFNIRKEKFVSSIRPASQTLPDSDAR